MDRLRTARNLSLGAMAFGIVALSLGTSATSGASAKTITVAVDGAYFSPFLLTAQVGDTVRLGGTKTQNRTALRPPPVPRRKTFILH